SLGRRGAREMKALRSPWVSGGLAALALAFVGYQVLGGLRGHSSTSSGEQPVPVAVSAPVAWAPVSQGSGGLQPSPSKAPQASSDNGMDRPFIGLHFTNCTEGGKRDPLLLHAAVQQDAATNAPSQQAKWKLKAIWNQTGSRVAVLNNTLYQEGDTIEGYKI